MLRGKEMAQQSFADPATVEVKLLSADEDVETGLHKAESFIFPETKSHNLANGISLVLDGAVNFARWTIKNERIL